MVEFCRTFCKLLVSIVSAAYGGLGVSDPLGEDPAVLGEPSPTLNAENPPKLALQIAS